MGVNGQGTLLDGNVKVSDDCKDCARILNQVWTELTQTGLRDDQIIQNLKDYVQYQRGEISSCSMVRGTGR